MLFNSFQFLCFFPLVCFLYYIIPFKYRHLFLLAASYYFYMCWNPQYALLMLTSTFITYLSGLMIDRAEKIEEEIRRVRMKKLSVAFSFVINLSILCIFKYSNFLIDTINRVFSYVHIQPVNVSFDIILPVGISFYTFQALSYTVDVYRKDIYCEKNFFKYALFVSFFPQLVAGPIERSKNLLKQIHVKHDFRLERVQYGLFQMLLGYFQKVVISDNISVFVDQAYDNYHQYGSIELIIATIFFALQIYCDFGGYSNIAIGAARVMGFDLMENFNTPYFADSVADFWRRWHISLSTWFRDYLYIPLGGNRKGRVRKYINLMIVFMCSGLWHGASWNYVVWGAINGAYQVVGDILKPVKTKIGKVLGSNPLSFGHKFLQVVVTFVLVDFSWIFFRAKGFAHASKVIKRMLTEWDPWVLVDDSLFELGIGAKPFHAIMVSILVLFAFDICKYLKVDVLKGMCRQDPWFKIVVAAFFACWILLLGSYGPEYSAAQFIYFQF